MTIRVPSVRVNDFVIIGSGFGGSIPALLLSRAGCRTVLIERGPWRDTLPMRSGGVARVAPLPRGGRFATHLLYRLHHRRLPARGLQLHRDGMLELFFGNGVKVVCSSNVGGGSHVYGGLHALPLRADYWEGVSDAVDAARMAPHYAAVLDLFRSKKLAPADGISLPYMPWEHKTDQFVDVPEHEAPWWGYRFPATPGRPQLVDADGYQYREVNFIEESMFGSPTGGKMTLDATCLLPAMRAGLEVHDGHEALAISRLASGGFVVTARDRRGRTVDVQARRVIVAAGAVNTVALLLRSRAGGGIAGMPRLGCGFGTNADLTAKWLVNTPGADYPATGIYKRLFRHRDDRDGPVLMQTGVYGLETLPLPRRLKNRLARQLTLAAMGIDSANGRIRLADNGRIDVHYDMAQSPVYQRIKALFKLVEQQSGIAVKGYDAVPVTPHPLGGARAGRSAADSVVNGLGEVHDVPGLFVTDASALPRALGAPPSLSIAAWAHHVARALV